MNPQKTSIDWLKFRTKSDPFAALEAMRPAFGTAADLVTLGDQVKGKDGWTWRRPVLLAGDLVLGNIDYGGDHMSDWVRVDLPGTACQWVQEWEVMAGLVYVLEGPASIMRLDVAFTTHHGEVTHEDVIAAHGRREFGTGGRHPEYREVRGSDPRAGRTIYVGKREAGKFLRCYEKGFEMLKEVPAALRDKVTGVELDGVGMVDPAKVYRVEVEFKDRDDRVVPWTAITARDDYFAGAYPFCASLLPDAAPRRVQPMPDFSSKMALASAIDNCRRSYGRIIKAAALAYGNDMERLFSMLTHEKPAQHLVDAGVLLVDHD